MGFQFNHVGGGTKTRRPITLHMQYNAGCVQPQCFLVTEDFGDQEVTLEELQVGACVLLNDLQCHTHGTEAERGNNDNTSIPTSEGCLSVQQSHGTVFQ